MSVELTRHMDPSPFVVRESLPLDRTYRLFRTLGLRHLVVLRQGLIVAGIITRKDFAFGMAAPMREQGEAVSLRYIRDSSLRQSNANARGRSPRPDKNKGVTGWFRPRASSDTSAALLMGAE